MDKQLAPWANAIVNAKQKFNAIQQSDVDYQREATFAKQAIMKNTYLMGIANKQHHSLQDAVINVAAVGLSLNPVTGYAYLVPRDNVCVLDISYKGLIKIATDSGSILWAKADLVYDHDTFVYNGPSEKPDHKADPFNDRGAFQGVYCLAKTIDGDYLVEVMPAEEIYKIRDLSSAYSKAKPGKSKGPWESFFEEMAKKTVIKRASKTWPKTERHERLDTAIDILNQHEGIEFNEDKRLFDHFMDSDDALGMYLFMERLRDDCGGCVETLSERTLDLLDIGSVPRGEKGKKREKHKALTDNGDACFLGVITGINNSDDVEIAEALEGSTEETMTLLKQRLNADQVTVLNDAIKVAA